MSGATATQPAIDLSLFFNLPTASGATARRLATYSVSGGFNTGAAGTTGLIGNADGRAQQRCVQWDAHCPAVQRLRRRPQLFRHTDSSSLTWVAGSQVNDCSGASPLTFSLNNVPATSAQTTIGTTISTTRRFRESGSLAGSWVLTLRVPDDYPLPVMLTQSGSSIGGSDVFPDLTDLPDLGLTIVSISSVISGTISGNIGLVCR